jgi:hypothetical protein
MAGELLTADAQIEWRGTLLGSGTYFGTSYIKGWFDLPGQRGSNAPLPNRHGSYPGRKLSSDRYVEWGFKIKNLPLSGFPAAIDMLRQITAPDEDPQEEPLVVRLAGESLLCFGRVHLRNIPTDKRFAIGYTEGMVVWEATDPRLYSVSEELLEIPLASPASDGLDFGGGGLDFGGGGLDFGAGTSGGKDNATNTGHVPTWPRLEITGPVTGPVVIFPGDRQLRFNPAFEVLSGQTLVIDTRPALRTVELQGTGSSVTRKNELWTKQWTPLDPGVSTEIRYQAAAYDATTRLRVFWRHAKH